MLEIKHLINILDCLEFSREAHVCLKSFMVMEFSIIFSRWQPC